MDDAVWYPSIHCSQHQVAVGGGPAAQAQLPVWTTRRRGLFQSSPANSSAEWDSPKGVAHHQKGHVADISVPQDLISTLFHQVPVGQDHLLPIELLLGLALAA